VDNHTPDPGPLHELDGALRRAVDALRRQPIPADAVERATERAQKCKIPRPWTKRVLPILASIAAMLCIGLFTAIQFSRVEFKPQSAGHANRTQAEDNLKQLGIALHCSTANDCVGPDWGNSDEAPAQTLPPPPGSGQGTGASIATPGRVFDVEKFDVRGGNDPIPGAVAMKVGIEPKSRPAKPDLPAPSEMPGTEQYKHFLDNPFLRPLANPLSTFSIAVDTASYSNVRRFLQQEGRLPPPDAVRVAELVNYFPYTYAQPRGEHPVGFTLDLTACPWQPKHHLARIALKGKQLDARQLPPRNFVFLVDTSGSMNEPNRLPLLKASLALLVEQLTARDRVALVAYAGSAGLVLPPTSGADKNTVLRALDRLDAGGSTNGGQGIELAYKVARESFLKGGINRVILGTDGDFNVGVTSEGDLVRLIEEQRKSGVFLTILGFGMGNLKDATMERLAHHGNGHYAYIDSMAEARKIFLEQGCSLVTIAKDVKIQVEFNPRTVGAYRLIGYENKLMKAEDFNDDKKHAGDIGSGHTVTALYEIVPPGLPVPGATAVDPLKYQKPPAPTQESDGGEWLTVKLRYKDPEAETSKLLAQPLASPVAKLPDAPADLRFAAAVAEFGLLLRSTEHRGTASYAGVRELAKGALGADPNGHRAEFLTLVDAAAKIAGGQTPAVRRAPVRD
jgi:Ca-activated chloride channel family protein